MDMEMCTPFEFRRVSNSEDVSDLGVHDHPSVCREIQLSLGDADDTRLFRVGKAEPVHSELQKNLSKLGEQAHKWQRQFNGNSMAIDVKWWMLGQNITALYWWSFNLIQHPPHQGIMLIIQKLIRRCEKPKLVQIILDLGFITADCFLSSPGCWVWDIPHQ